jgi:hypothetical protein
VAGTIATPKTDLYGTPDDLFASLHREFDFTIDLAASHEHLTRIREQDQEYEILAPANHKLPRWFGPGGIVEDALAADWGQERGFLNPPFSLIHQLVPKACQSARAGALVVMVCKVLSDTAIWHEYVMPFADRVRLIRGRLSYIQIGRDGAKSGPATFPAGVVIFRPGLERTPGQQFEACDRLGRPLQARLLEAA